MSQAEEVCITWRARSGAREQVWVPTPLTRKIWEEEEDEEEEKEGPKNSTK